MLIHASMIRKFMKIALVLNSYKILISLIKQIKYINYANLTLYAILTEDKNASRKEKGLFMSNVRRVYVEKKPAFAVKQKSYRLRSRATLEFHQ